MPRHLSRLLLLLAAAAAATLAAAAASNGSSNCTLPRDANVVRAAFLHVGNFPLPRPTGRHACRPVRRLRFPSRNLTGAVDWTALANLSGLLTVELSGNSLNGGIQAAFWRAPSLRAVDVSGNRLGGALRFDDPGVRLAALHASGNRFTSVEGVAGLARLEDLDVSWNAIAATPEGLSGLARLQRLDLSGNGMIGRFPYDLPPLDGLKSLNISHNNFSGVVSAEAVRKFGRSAFVQAGDASSLVIEGIAPAPAPSPPPSRSGKKRMSAVLIAVIAAGAVVTAAALAFLVGCVVCCLKRCRKKRGRKKKKDKDGKQAAVWKDEEVVVGAAKVAAAAPVVVLERPLMELTLADLAAATSGFGRESQLAGTGGRSGVAYRAVLPGDLHVIVRVCQRNQERRSVSPGRLPTTSP